MVFGMINIWQGVRVARGEIYHAHFSFCLLSKFLLYSLHGCWSIHKHYFHVLLLTLCVFVCVIALEAKF